MSVLLKYKVMDRFCSQPFQIWDGQNLGQCFQQLCFIYPTFILLLICSSYYSGFRKLSYSLRTNYERSIIYIRILISILLCTLTIYQFYVDHVEKSVKIPAVDLIQVILISLTCVIHILFLRKLLCGVTYKIRGPNPIIISFILCFVATCAHIYFKCKSKNESFTILSISIVSLQVFYIITLIPSNGVRHEYAHIVNSSLEEEEPLIGPALSRYYGFNEEVDPYDLGIAEESSNVLSKMLFIWVQPLMLKGFNKNLKCVEDLYDLPLSLQTSHLYERNTFVNADQIRNDHAKVCGLPTLALIKQLHRLFAWEFYSIGILKFFSDTLSFGGPLLLNSLVSFLESKEEKHILKGYYFALGLFLVTFFSAVSSVQYNYLISRVGLKIKASIIMMVYKKTLCLSKVTLSSMHTGEILNFISTDTDRIVNFCQSFHQFWSLPIQVMIALVLLYQQLNFCFIIGVVFMIIIIPINQIVAKKIASYSALMMQAKDKRIKIMNEIISGIRIIKMNSWEAIFSKKLFRIRHQELKYLKKRKYLDALCVYFWATTPVLMSFLTFSLFASLGYALTAAKVFTSIALFNILITPLNAFPWVINGLVEAWISVKRVNAFLQLSNLDLSQYYSNLESAESNTDIEILNGMFAYNPPENLPERVELTPTRGGSSNLTDCLLGPIDLKLSKGDFVCVIGKVGSGKSSLFSGILGDMNCVSGHIKLNMSERSLGIGYVSQEPWIQQKTIKDNILFGKSFNILKYRRVLEACGLIEDLEALPYGDGTEVGDKGVTLSGGQKARVALARAVYQDFDVYLLDDPLSAIDAHVGDHIFSNCLMGLLKHKTRILCTHKTQYAEHADYLMVLSEGKVITHEICLHNLKQSPMNSIVLFSGTFPTADWLYKNFLSKSYVRAALQAPPNQALQLYMMNSDDENEEEKKQDISIDCIKNSIEESENSHALVEKEEKEEGVVKLHVYKTYWKAVGTILPGIVLFFCFLMQASRTVSDWWLSYWVSSVNQTSNTSLDYEVGNLKATEYGGRSLLFYLGIYGGLAASNSIFTLFRAFLFAFSGIKAAVSIHNRLVNIIMKATTCFFDITPLGRIMNRFSSDIYCIDDSFPFILNILLAQVFSLAGCIIITCYGLPYILVPISILSVLYCNIQQYYRHTSRELKRLSSISLSPIYAHFSETLDGQSTIRAMSASGRFQKENMEHIDSNMQACLATAAASQWLNIRLQFIGVIIVTCVALIALVKKEFDYVDPGLVGLALSYALSVTALLNGSITSFTETEKEIVSVERVMQYIEGVKTEVDHSSQLPPFAWPSHGVIAFTNVSLQYRPSCPYALKNVTFETRPGEKVGVVGRTGSGKSSLVQVLFRMVDSYEGAVFIDGVDIGKLQLERLRSSLSVIPQHPYLFSGTIRQNLDPQILKSDSQIWKALKDCHMEEKIMSLGGLDVEVEEQGQNFSIGERQLVCLARALLRRSKILCMDEATASIDYHTDSLIRHTVRMSFRRSTLIVIAHRTETILDCDRVIVMKDGQIVELDKPSILLSDPNSEFYKLVYSKSD